MSGFSHKSKHLLREFNQEEGPFPFTTMTKSFRAVSCGMIVALLASTSIASACCRVSFDVGPVHVDTGHPLQPVTTTPVKVPGGTITLPAPGPVPTTPSVQLDKNIPGAGIVNQADKILHIPETAVQNGANAVGKGIEHLGNEIGMLWAHAKQDAIDMAKGWLDWLLALAKKYAPIAFGIVFSAMMLAAAIVVYLPKMILTLFRRARPERRRTARHA
jgi:hypothetical protein